MTTLGWLGWRSIWPSPKGGEAATVPCRIHAHGSPQLPYRNTKLFRPVVIVLALSDTPNRSYYYVHLIAGIDPCGLPDWTHSCST
jgi:hypothetical protein